MTERQRIVFNGNGYSDEWVAEAERRGLPNIKSMIGAASTITTDKAAVDALRTPVDKLEMLVDGEVWSIPTYGDLMFEV